MPGREDESLEERRRPHHPGAAPGWQDHLSARRLAAPARRRADQHPRRRRQHRSGSFFDARLVDKIYAFVGDKVIGGTGALPSVGGCGVDELDECMPLSYDSVELHENNVLITAYNANREGAYVHWHH